MDVTKQFPSEAQATSQQKDDYTNGAGRGDENLRSLLFALQSARDGDFSIRLPSDWTGLYGKVADAFNDIVSANQRMSQQLHLAGQFVGREGKTRHRLRLGASRGPGARWRIRSTP